MNEQVSPAEGSGERDEAAPDASPRLASSSASDLEIQAVESVLDFCEGFLTFYRSLFHASGALLDLGKHRLTRGQFFVLLRLQRYQRMTMSQVAATLANSKEQATRTVSSLVELGLVERLEDQHNRKLVLVHLTEAGRTFLAQEKGKVKQNLLLRFQSLDPVELAGLKEGVTELSRYFSRLEQG